MSLLGFLGGYDENPYDNFHNIAIKQYNTAADYRNGKVGNELYQKNKNASNSILATAYNNLRKDLAAKNLDSTALLKQNALELQSSTNEKLNEANLDAWGKIQEMGYQYENLANLSERQYGEGEAFKAEQQNSFLDNVIGLGGSIATEFIGTGSPKTTSGNEMAVSPNLTKYKTPQSDTEFFKKQNERQNAIDGSAYLQSGKSFNQMYNNPIGSITDNIIKNSPILSKISNTYKTVTDPNRNMFRRVVRGF